MGPGRARRAGVLLLAGALLAAGCRTAPAPPEAVARRFWAALAAGDTATALSLCADADEPALRELAERRPWADVAFGETLRNTSRAVVETRAPRPGRPERLVFETHLAQADGRWRVLVEPTRRALGEAALGAALEDVESSAERSSAALGRMLEENAVALGEALSRALDELRRSLPNEPGGPEPDATP